VIARLTQNNLNQLVFIPVPGPFYAVRGTLFAISGAAPTLALQVSTSPEPGGVVQFPEGAAATQGDSGIQVLGVTMPAHTYAPLPIAVAGETPQAQDGNTQGVLAMAQSEDSPVAVPIAADGSGHLTPGAGHQNIGKQDGQPYTAGDIGPMVLGVVDDGTVPVPAVGDYTPPRLAQNGGGILLGGRDPNSGTGNLGASDPNGNGALVLWVQPDPAAGAFPVTGTVSVANTVSQVQSSTDRTPPAQQTGPIAISNFFFGGAASGRPQRSLSVCVKANGTMVAFAASVITYNAYGDASAAVLTLAIGDLGVLKGVVDLPPFTAFNVYISAATAGTATQFTIDAEAVPE